MEQLFTTLSHAIAGAAGIAMTAAFVWGILSILLSPCHLASIPLIVGFIDQQGQITTRRAFIISLLFSLGILITIGVIGAITASAGRMLGDVGRYGNYFVAVIFFVVGLYLLDVIRLPMPGAAKPGMKRKGMLAALILGLVFGIALGPCTFAYMAYAGDYIQSGGNKSFLRSFIACGLWDRALFGDRAGRDVHRSCATLS